MPDRPEPTSSFRPIRPEAFGEAQARRLLWRAGFGGTPAQLSALTEMGPERAVDLLLNADTDYDGPRGYQWDQNIMLVDDTARDEYRRAQRAGDEETLARLRLSRQEQQRRDRRQIQRMQQWWLARMIESPAPLLEKMTLLWHSHFAASYRKTENSWHMLAQNNTFRKHALGNFADLLFAIVRDPAMIQYLDNHTSRKQQPNENLARELMELFSLGVGNYTEQDIKEGARALTGHTFEGNDFVFRENWHDDGMKRILAASGRMTGDDFVKAILEQRRCAEFISWKLYRAFVVNDLPEDLRQAPRWAALAVRELTRELLNARYQLKPALRALFLSEHFYDPAFEGSLIKSPAELVVGAIRSLNTPVRDLAILVDAMDRMGQALFFPPSVAGWDGGRSWISTSTMFIRQNTLVYLINGTLPVGRDARADLDAYNAMHIVGSHADARTGAERILRRTLGELAPTRVDWLTAHVQSLGPEWTPALANEALALATATPEYQLL
ncbi:MAG: DUF1800 family protein [Phycisphaerales bacterium]